MGPSRLPLALFKGVIGIPRVWGLRSWGLVTAYYNRGVNPAGDGGNPY